MQIAAFCSPVFSRTCHNVVLLITLLAIVAPSTHLLANERYKEEALGAFANLADMTRTGSIVMKTPQGYLFIYGHTGHQIVQCNDANFPICAYIKGLRVYFVVPEGELKRGQSWEAFDRRFTVISSWPEYVGTIGDETIIEVSPSKDEYDDLYAVRFIFSPKRGIISFMRGTPTSDQFSFYADSKCDPSNCLDTIWQYVWIGKESNLPMLTGE